MTTPSYPTNIFRFQGVRRMTVLNWWRLISIPSSELPSLELSWAWKPVYREKAWRYNLGKRFICHVYSWDIGRWSKARYNANKYWFWYIYIYIYIKKKRVVPKVGRGGGLVLFLKSSVNLVVVGSLHSYMLVLGHMWNLLRTYVI